MPLPDPDVKREFLHTRTFRVDAYARADGLMDLDAELTDVKGYDFTRSSGEIHKAGRPVHNMHVRLTVDKNYTITAATVSYEAAPYGDWCASIAPAYEGLVGMNLVKGFRNAVREKFGRSSGCTHVTELSYVLPTVALQATAGSRRRERENANPDAAPQRPFELEGCHALKLDAPAVAKFYPLWFQAPAGKPAAGDGLQSSSHVQTGNK
jgi:hypothetical protein